jgi:nucleoside-diphosphate-sugar epimerase
MPGDLSRKRILVTGATGFIGGRVVEKLILEYHASVRVLVRNYVRALRVARYPVEMVGGDVTDADDVERAAKGCDHVIHCAYGSSGTPEAQRAVNVQGTRNILEVVSRSGARLIHLSTVQVYGPLQDGDLDETTPRRYFGDSYSNSKLDAENLVLDYVSHRRLPAIILQPTVVYGPYAPTWTESVLKRLKRGRQILVNGGDGLCNAVYIDDVADAILLALVHDTAVGESFLISGDRPVTWREFYGSYERMLGESATVSMSVKEARRQKRGEGILEAALGLLRDEPTRRRLAAAREAAMVRRLVRSLLPVATRQSIKDALQGVDATGRPAAARVATKPVLPLSFPLDARFYAAKTTVRIDKAKRLLGYQPGFDLESGMRWTEKWARWANLLDGERG